MWDTRQSDKSTIGCHRETTGNVFCWEKYVDWALIEIGNAYERYPGESNQYPGDIVIL